MAKNHRDEFMRLFNDTARYHHRYDVFRDFVMMAGISIHNAIYKSEILEQEYMDIVKKYKKDDAVKMAHLLSEVVMGMELNGPCDFLGSVFMELELGNAKTGQYFTPYEISRLMTKLTLSEIEITDEERFITLQEPACGSGGMVIAFAQEMAEAGFDYQKQLWVSCIDVDPVPAMMCYLQLSLLHIPAEIVTGNTITLEYSRVMRTPAHYLGFWEQKLQRRWSKDELTDVAEIVDVPGIPETEVNEAKSAVLSHSEDTAPEEQLSLFDVVL